MTILHITSGDIAGETLADSGVPGTVLVWHDMLYDGPRNPGWPQEDTLHARARFLEEATGAGLARLESLALKTILEGCESPGKIFSFVAAADAPPQHWGDITLWAKVNGPAERQPPLVKIYGPGSRLPQWKSEIPLQEYRIKAFS